MPALAIAESLFVFVRVREQKLFGRVMEEVLVARSKLPVQATYRAVGSSTGQKEFVCDPADVEDSTCE